MWWLKPASGPSDIPWYGTNFPGVAPTLNPNTNWELIPASAFVTEIPSLDGDYNDDGTVDAAVYIVWRKLEGTSTMMRNDPNPLPIDGDQYAIWRESFGIGNRGAGGASVPEPAGILLVLGSILAMAATLPRCPK